MAETNDFSQVQLDQTRTSPPRYDDGEAGYPDEKLDKNENAAVDPFGDEGDAEVKYKTMNWYNCGFAMIAETVSLGILSLPSAVASLGLVPAIIVLVFLGGLATYTGYVIGQFKKAYPQVHNMADAGEVLMGPFGRELLGAGQLLFLVFIMASHILTFTVMMNHLTDHGTCSIVFGVVGLIISFISNLPRTMKNMSWFSYAAFCSVVASVFVTMIAIGIQNPGNNEVKAVVKTDLYHGFLAVSNIVFAYAGHVAFFGFISEMEVARDYPKALFMLQGFDTTLYIVSAIVIYRYGGEHVASPALGSTGPIVSKVAYGIAAPTIVIAGVINGHVACKYLYVRIFRGTDHMSKRSWLSVGTWWAIAAGLWILAWIIASAIPVFNNLLSLITALFASWFTYGLSGVFWLYINKGQWFSSWKKTTLAIINFLIFLIGALICGLGLWVSGTAIHNDQSGTGSFSCADNSV